MKYIPFIILMLLALTSCALFLPEKAKDQPYSEGCELLTKKLVLSSEPRFSGNGGNGGSCDLDCLRLLLIIPAGSLIVSGSIVIANNTLHWVEYESRCKHKIGKLFENGKKVNVEPIKESCVLECNLVTNECKCLSKITENILVR
jgi:hypothetical protein